MTVNRILRRFGFKPVDEIIRAEARKNDPEKAEVFAKELRRAQEEWQRFCRPGKGTFVALVLGLMVGIFFALGRNWLAGPPEK